MSQNNILHLITIPFTGVGIWDFKSQEWFDYRIELFKKYTLKSLLSQTNKNFVLWLTFRPQEYKNPSTQRLVDYVRNKGIRAIISYAGLMYWDDKFNMGPIDTLTNIARVLRSCYREKSLKGLWRLKNFFNKKNKLLLNRLGLTLNNIKKVVDNLDWVYLTRIDSDDMFRNDMVEKIQEVKPFSGAITVRSGYVYNDLTCQMAEWNPTTNPPFFTLVFPYEDFIDPDRHLAYWKGYKSHEDVPRLFNTWALSERGYCVLVHGNHISTFWDHPFRGKLVDCALLKEFV